MKVLRKSVLCRILGVNGITLYPFVFVRDANPAESLLNHERIHIAQVERLGVARFYFLYLKEYFQNRRKGLSHQGAYREISFEKEAFRFQDNPEELLGRRDS